MNGEDSRGWCGLGWTDGKNRCGMQSFFLWSDRTEKRRWTQCFHLVYRCGLLRGFAFCELGVWRVSQAIRSVIAPNVSGPSRNPR